jgi:GR25 family glycosyltransferase involved in LPS biosynthesis
MSGATVSAFVIHLQRAEKRRPQVERLRAALPMPTQIVDGVDGRILPDAEAAKVYRPRLAAPTYPFPLLRTEIACFLSHRKAWQAIVDSGLDSGLVLEDDVAPEQPLFDDVCRFVLRHIQPGDYVRLPYRTHTDGGTAVATEGTMTLVDPRLPGMGMQAQIIGRGAAQALLRATETFDRPVDAVLQLDGIPGVRMLAARPVCIRQIAEQLGGTVVQKKNKSLGEVLDREVRRAWYRLGVWCRSRMPRSAG